MSASDLTLDPQSWPDFRALAHRMVDGIERADSIAFDLHK